MLNYTSHLSEVSTSTGPKLVESKKRFPILPPPKNIKDGYVFDETLSLLATLYYDKKKDLYLEKSVHNYIGKA